MTGKLVKEFAGSKKSARAGAPPMGDLLPVGSDAGKFKDEVIYSIRPL